MSPDWTQYYQAPHCDQRVLHSPKSGCDFCNDAPLAQALRECLGINYTGETDPDKLLCPSEHRRPVETINQWGGNRPAKKNSKFRDFFGYGAD